jgi:CHAT domain-containing protein
VSITSLPAANVLDEKIATLLGLVSLETAEEKAAGEELHDMLLGPLAGQVGASDLLIVPTGALCRLPFELLREPGPRGRRYLGEARAVRYAPSLTALRTLVERDRLDESRPDRPFWAMANPRDPVGVPPSELGALPALDGALGEVERIAAIVGGGEGAQVLVEAEATRAAVLGASREGSLRRYRYLHFAAHGSMEDEAHPLPGLILAPSPGEEGFLDAEDVGHLDLDADLVVLSACESGRGRIFNGEGVRGLSGAFLIAGARGVVCSLWKVDDEETARFMEAFYARLRAGDAPTVALKEVRRAAARKQSSPQWSAFIFVGGVSP